MAMTTRSKSSRVKTYRSRVKTSKCRKLGRATCRRTAGCKQANGSKRRFCRKGKNTRVTV
jgi:hypothetical protein